MRTGSLKRTFGVTMSSLISTLVAATFVTVGSTATSAAVTPVSQPGTGLTGAQSQITTDLPTVTSVPPTSGTHGYPYDAVPSTPVISNAPSIDLAAHGYAQQEFLMSGTTNVYQEQGFWGPNGQWGVSVSQSNVPYTTRLLVRYPTSPSAFNGTVVVEWLNDTTGGDQDPVWSELYNEILNNGYAYVGVTAQAAGVGDLKAWDPTRYGALSENNDGQSYDIFTQAAEAVVHDGSTLFGGLTPKDVIGSGDSQSALRVDTYVNAFQPLFHQYNGFLAVGRAAVAAPIGNGLASLTPIPADIRTNNTTPFIQLQTEGDVYELQSVLARQPDNSYLRTWEVAGASHIDEHEATYETETIFKEEPTMPIPQCQFGVPTGIPNVNNADSMPLFEVEDAALTALQNWVIKGVQPPRGQSIATIPFFNTVERDQYQNALGGIRLPEIQVPTATYSAINFAVGQANSAPSLSTLLSLLTLLTTGASTDLTGRSEGLCLLSGYDTPFTTTTLRQLYPTHADYLAKYDAAIASDLNAGFLTPYDAYIEYFDAQASSVP
jgi:hypothetical protein